MEDGVSEAESLLHPVNLAAAEDGEEKENGNGSGGDEGKESGFVSNLISNLVPSRSGEEKAEEEQEEKKDEEDGSGGDERKESGFISNLISNLVLSRESEEEKAEEEQEERKDEEKGGGLLSNLISNLVSPVTSPKPIENGVKVEDFEGKDGIRNEDGGTRSEAEVGTSDAGGGPAHSFINNFFHKKCEGKLGKNEQEIQKIETVQKKNEPVKSDKDEGGGGGGGLISNIISHLPDAAPSTDEASILIHSIVHD
ncbi:cilia- and flagella-associated protein 251 isoform X2 [Carica papaya]|uniref:cilia- and flagella-associated protein 251 isoform X2 n=1 Tax=Carica papaya TaxID=3649 RepID=UPI000B8D0CB3|nr:cilia- and flagella-associated protein 251 isoform X2 [Carica papaya]